MLLQKFPLTFPPPSSLIKHNRNISSSFLFHEMKLKTSSRISYYKYSSSSLIICAVEKESEFELDQDKAREALEKLDQQLQSLSNKQGVTTQPRKKVIAPVVEYDREKQTMKEELPEFSDSYFAFSALTLLALTILYNIFFITVIKPSVDGHGP